MRRIWAGNGVLPRVGRLLLAPAEGAFRAGIAARGMLYERKLFPVHSSPVPALSVGNLTVGGTGKTPVAAWFAARLREAGAHPAIVMRGYGGDEALVHSILNPDIPVVTHADRVIGVHTAARQGADCVVLDDAFQHRRIARTVNVVLVSADGWNGRVRLLPAGPWREPLSALSRSTLIIVTRKSAATAPARQLAEMLGDRFAVPTALFALGLGALSSADRTEPLERLHGRQVMAIAAIGDPRAFQRQLEAVGATVRTRFFGDHHHFTAGEVQGLASQLRDDEWAVCTLKDYVKLVGAWPRQAPALWYVSQRVAPETGESAVNAALDSVLRARSSEPPTGR